MPPMPANRLPKVGRSFAGLICKLPLFRLVLQPPSHPCELGAKGWAFVVPRDAADPPALAELRAFVGSELASYKRPDGLTIVDELPLNAMLKVDKLELLPASAAAPLRDARLRQRAGVLVLALREPDGTFNTNPDPDTVIAPHHVIIAVGTDEALRQLTEVTV